MSTHNQLAAIDDLLGMYEHRARVLSEVRELVSKDPQLAKDLAAALSNGHAATGSNGQPSGYSIDRSSSGLTHYAQIRQFFDRTDNSWAKVADVIAGTGLKRGAVAHIFYKTHKGDFDKRSGRGRGGVKLWRMTIKLNS